MAQKSNKKKILYVITKSVWGGAQRYVYDLATNLPQKKYSVVVTAGGDGPLFDLLKKKKIATVFIPALMRDVNILNEFRVFYNLLKIYKKEKPDIIHLNSSKIGILGALAGKVFNFRKPKKAKIIFTIHGWVFKEERLSPIKLILYALVRLNALLIDSTIIISRSDLRDARKFIKEDGLAFIPNGIKNFSPLPIKEAKKIILSQTTSKVALDTPLIGIIAELTKNKGITYAIEAFVEFTKKYPEKKYHLVLIGDGEEKEKLRKKEEAAGYAHRIHFIGFQKDASLLLSAIDIFLFPSLKEGLPYSILEAMASSLPIVATNVGGIPDLIRHKKEGLLVLPKNSNAIASALETLITNPVLKEQLGKQAKKRSQTYFTLDQMIAKTSELYQTKQ